MVAAGSDQQQVQIDGQRACCTALQGIAFGPSLTRGRLSQRAHTPRSALPCLYRSCFSLRCACEFCSFVFAELPTPSRPSAVPAHRVVVLFLLRALY